MSDGLTEAEQQFFATGDASVLGAQPQESAPAPVEATNVSPADSAPPPALDAPVLAPAPPADPSADLQAQLAAERARNASFQDQMAAIQDQLAKLNTRVEPTPAAPDPSVDPLGAMMHQQQQIQKQVESLNAQLTTQQQQALQQKQFNDFVGNLQKVREDFIKTNADFPQAYAHLRQSRMQDLRDVGVPEDRIPQALLQDEIAVASSALQRGKNPAEVMYGMAKRYGYTPKAPAANASQKLQNVIAGQQAATHPQRTATDSPLTFEALKDLSDTDLDKMAQDDKLWAKTVGNTVTGKDIFS